MTEFEREILARDLIARTERAVEKIMRTAVDTGITFQVSDIVEAVEDDLPGDYPSPTTEGHDRREMIDRMARDIISGDMYEQE